MYPSELRNLAASYRGGFLERDKYRRQRRQWLRALQDGELVLRHPQPAPEPDENATMPAFPYTLAPDPAPRPMAAARPPRPWLIPVLVMLVGILLLAAILLLKNNPGPPPQDAPTTSALETLSRAFLEKNQWGNESMQQLLGEWSSQPPAAPGEDPSRNWQKRLQDVANRQRDQARALAELGDPAASARLQTLNTLLELLAAPR